jgi:hypothetical protein
MWFCELCGNDGCDFDVDCVICQRCAHSQPFPVGSGGEGGDGGDEDNTTEFGSGKKYNKHKY